MPYVRAKAASTIGFCEEILSRRFLAISPFDHRAAAIPKLRGVVVKGGKKRRQIGCIFFEQKHTPILIEPKPYALENPLKTIKLL